jgi:hypothetical protein
MKNFRKKGSFAGKIVVVVAAVLGGGALVSSSCFAALSAVATGENTVDSGTLKLEKVAHASFTAGITTNITNMASVDTVNRYIDLNSTGTLDGATPKLQLTAGSSALTNQSSGKGLHITIMKCTVSYTAVTGACSGTETTALANTSVYDLNAAAVAGVALAIDTVSNAVNHLKVNYTIVGDETTVNGVLPTAVDSFNPTFSGSSIQGVSATSISWVFRQDVRTPVNSNS